MSVFASLLNHTFTISRRVRVSDGQGGWPFVLEPVAEVEGRIRPATSREREVAMLEEREVTYVLYVPAGTDIARADIVSVETEDLTVEVGAVREPSKAGHHLEVDCRERQVEQPEVEAGS